MSEQARAALLEIICLGFSKLNDFQKGYFLGVGDGLTLSNVQSQSPTPDKMIDRPRA